MGEDQVRRSFHPPKRWLMAEIGSPDLPVFHRSVYTSCLFHMTETAYIPEADLHGALSLHSVNLPVFPLDGRQWSDPIQNTSMDMADPDHPAGSFRL